MQTTMQDNPETKTSGKPIPQNSIFQRVVTAIPLGYVLRRLFLAIPTMLLIITVAFFLMRAAPGNPYSTDRKLAPEVEANMKAALGLDKPLIEQYGNYLGNVVQGDLGPSMRNSDKSVSEIIGDGIGVSLTLGACSMVLAIFIGTALGIGAAIRKNTMTDYSIMAFAMLGISVPTFVIGPILSLAFGVWWGLFSAGGLDLGRMNFSNMFLPVVTLALPQIAIISRLMRASMIEVLQLSYLRTARAKGLSDLTILLRHAAPAAALPLVSYIGPATAGLLTGSVVIERVFSLPGVGQYFIDGAINRDFPLVMGVVILYSGLIVIFNLIADVVYGVLDPRVSYN
ncbi:ABC transporter permease [Hirschia litorea]|uniref:ABC transporter permease n=1 Tax=Hirschia litorea TaxID=1199156 RepID=A0ABW2IJ27_9PROT